MLMTGHVIGVMTCSFLMDHGPSTCCVRLLLSTGMECVLGPWKNDVCIYIVDVGIHNMPLKET